MFDWSAFLDVAQRLARDANDEAAQRSALSRAYYAVLGTAHRRLLEHGWHRPPGSLHLHVWRSYQGARAADCARIGQLGFVLRDRRNRADYDDPFPGNLERVVARTLPQAEDVLTWLAQVDPDETCF